MTASSTDVFVAKYASDGTLQWADLYGDASDQLAFAVATDGSGNVWVVGAFTGTLSFGGPTLSAAGMFNDVFVAKLDPDGGHLQSDAFGNDSDVSDPADVAVDSSDGAVVVGRFQSSIDFGGESLVAAGGAGDFDAFVVHFDDALVPIEAERYGDDAGQRLAAVALDGDDAVMLAGSSQGAIDFGGGVLDNSAGERAVLAKLQADGTHVFSVLFTGDDAGGARSVAVGPSGDIVVVGVYTTSIDFGDGVVMSGGADNDDAFVARFDADGNLVSGDGYGDGSTQRATAVAIDSLDRPVFTGTKVGLMNVGGALLPAFGASDAYVAKLTPTAAAYWADAFGDAENQTGVAVAVAPDDATLWAANVSGNVDLGVAATCSGCQNAVMLAKLGP
jgi:hypothetical protein